MSTYEHGGQADAMVRSAARALTESICDTSLPVRLGTGFGPRDLPGPGRAHVVTGAGLRAADLTRVREMVETLRRLVFPGFFDPEPPAERLEQSVEESCRKVAQILEQEVRGAMRYGRREGHGGPTPTDEQEFVAHVVASFLGRLAGVRASLALDVHAAYDGDPAAEHTDEIILCYPGMDATFTHRLAHELYGLGVPLLPRVMSEQAHSRTGIDIHPGARIGESFFIDHGSATVIGETSIIGKQVKIYQGVTLGARSFPKDERGRAIRGIKRHPTIGDRVTIYAGAVILGGDTVIGDDCVIAGGVFVTASVPAGHVVQQLRPDLILKPAPTSKGVKPAPPTPAPVARAMESADIGWLSEGAGI